VPGTRGVMLAVSANFNMYYPFFVIIVVASWVVAI